MGKFFLIRSAQSVLTLFLLSVLVFVATQALPGDAAQAILGRDASPERVAALRELLNLNDPVLTQYVAWVSGIFRGDLGQSLVNGQAVWDMISPRISSTAFLVLVSAGIGIPFSLLLGVWSGVRRGTKREAGASVVLLILAGIPEFVLGFVFILLFATGVLKILPSVSVIESGGSVWAHPDVAVPPALTLICAIAPYVARIMRTSVIEVLETDYVEMARLKGVPESTIVRRHVIPNALVPAIQVSALQLAWLAGGVVVVEYVFAYPGIGAVLVDAATNRDIPVVQSLVLLAGAVYLLLNLLADVVSILVTPKLRTQMLTGREKDKPLRRRVEVTP